MQNMSIKAPITSLEGVYLKKSLVDAITSFDTTLSFVVYSAIIYMR